MAQWLHGVHASFEKCIVYFASKSANQLVANHMHLFLFSQYTEVQTGIFFQVNDYLLIMVKAN